MTFKYHNIAQREARDGYTGLTYSKKPQHNVPPNQNLGKKPVTFTADSIKKTLSQTDKNRFEEETIERQRFLDAKIALNGKKDVTTYEDRTQLKFDPVEQYEKERSGYATYNSGRHQSGTRGDQAFMKEGTYLPEGRGKFTSLKHQDPYRVKLPSAVKIRQ